MTKEAKAKRPDLTAHDACRMMHVALRKCCDSAITSAAYNLVFMINIEPDRFNPWVVFGGLVLEELRRSPTGALQRARERLDDTFYEPVIALRREGKDGAVPDGAVVQMHALDCTLRCFSDEDWAGMAAFLKGEV